MCEKQRWLDIRLFVTYYFLSAMNTVPRLASIIILLIHSLHSFALLTSISGYTLNHLLGGLLTKPSCTSRST